MNSTPSRVRSYDEPRSGLGFTLIELMVVVAIIGILAGVLLAALTKSKARAQGIFCMNNNRQLTVAWMLYADDHNGRLAYNLGLGSSGSRVSGLSSMTANRVNNVLNWEVNNPDNTNVNKLVSSGIGP